MAVRPGTYSPMPGLFLPSLGVSLTLFSVLTVFKQKLTICCPGACRKFRASGSPLQPSKRTRSLQLQVQPTGSRDTQETTQELERALEAKVERFQGAQADLKGRNYTADNHLQLSKRALRLGLGVAVLIHHKPLLALLEAVAVVVWLTKVQ